MTTEEATEARIIKCQVEVQRVLDEHNCQLDVSVILKANTVIPQVGIISK